MYRLEIVHFVLLFFFTRYYTRPGNHAILTAVSRLKDLK